ncbi:Xylulose kinase [Jannaschia seosinensis]|uniref:Xylulose kinase n=1 Tax=Jannaschia seosinensis TaxID=313367 RepID=A0A0M7BAX7_9RHOB|nr:xylulokinase [Jannaschia seosinensis]CUH39890.1 Xylulose kinase [Jannaschia seosinensis]
MYLGLDLGTSSLKALLIDAAQSVVAEATAPLDVQRPRSGWSEQDATAWEGACEKAVRGLDADLSKVRAIGLAGHMHGATLVDGDDRPLRPCLLWNDTRAADEATAMDDAQARRITGNIVFPGFTAPKAEWVRRTEPEIWDRVARILLPKDYLRLWLTGEAVSEMSDAAGTAWLDVGARDWSEAMLARQGLTRDHMPRLVEGSEISARLRDELADRLGLPRGTPVAGGAGDNAAAAMGTGAVAPGQGFVSLGTSGVLFVSSAAFQPAPETAVHTFCHAVPDTWHQMGVILNCTDSLEWAARLTGRDAGALASGDLMPPGRPLFLPYLGGERTPHNDAGVRGSLLGIEHATDAAALGRAVMEGVAFALRDNLDALRGTGTPIERLLAVGGGARSETWLRMIATVLDMPLHLPRDGQFGAALGACRLAMMADGAGSDVAEAPPIDRVIEPDPDLRDAFTEGHARFKAAYAPTRTL